MSQDLPLDLVVLADLGIGEEHAEIGRLHRLEPDGLAPYMAAVKPRVTAGNGERLTFEEARAFRPESLAARERREGRAARSAASNSSMDWYRLVGAFSRQRRTTDSSRRGKGDERSDMIRASRANRLSQSSRSSERAARENRASPACCSGFIRRRRAASCTTASI